MPPHTFFHVEVLRDFENRGAHHNGPVITAEDNTLRDVWPDFDEHAFDAPLQEYARRERRFGAIHEDPFVRSGHG